MSKQNANKGCTRKLKYPRTNGTRRQPAVIMHAASCSTFIRKTGFFERSKMTSDQIRNEASITKLRHPHLNHKKWNKEVSSSNLGGTNM